MRSCAVADSARICAMPSCSEVTTSVRPSDSCERKVPPSRSGVASALPTEMLMIMSPSRPLELSRATESSRTRSR